MVLRSAIALLGALEGVGPEMAQAKRVPFGPKKVDHYVPRHKNNRYINSLNVNLAKRSKGSYF